MAILPKGLRPMTRASLLASNQGRIESCGERVTVRPTVHGDACDGPGGIKTHAAHHARQLIADFSRELRERRLQGVRSIKRTIGSPGK